LGKDTASIFSNGATKVTPTTFDPTQLHSGDLVGWKKGDSGSGKVEDNGHVMIYLGNGKVLDTQPNSYGGTAIRNLSDYTKRITYVNWSKP
jgi:cell wall-associated NlpC family hydrolase